MISLIYKNLTWEAFKLTNISGLLYLIFSLPTFASQSHFPTEDSRQTKILSFYILISEDKFLLFGGWEGEVLLLGGDESECRRWVSAEINKLLIKWLRPQQLISGAIPAILLDHVLSANISWESYQTVGQSRMRAGFNVQLWLNNGFQLTSVISVLPLLLLQIQS